MNDYIFAKSFECRFASQGPRQATRYTSPARLDNEPPALLPSEWKRHVRSSMTLLSLVWELYSLDTLDTRFTNSSSTPLEAVDSDTPQKAGSRDGRDGKTQPADIAPPRWRTPEFYVYLLAFLFCVPQMYWAVVSVSQRRCEGAS